jgi:hypothetical protein
MANKIYISFLTGKDAVSGTFTLNLQAKDDRDIILDSTDILFKQPLSEYRISESSWVGQISADELIKNNKYIEFVKIYNEKTKLFLNIIIYTNKTENYKSTIISQPVEIKWDERLEGFNFQDIDIDKNFELPSLNYDTETISKLKSSFKDLEAQYLVAKAQYETEVKDAGLIVFEQNESYEPSNGTYIITRMLEFQLGTLVPALRHFKKTQNNLALQCVQTTDRSITNLVKLFPDIKIDDGEGMPYQ